MTKLTKAQRDRVRYLRAEARKDEELSSQYARSAQRREREADEIERRAALADGEGGR